uniref:Transient receptor potential cation channel, subfamily M, member 2 n=1 Tax=Peromyscus maniculatus bairdii TaxID=230844 RepID=A0A8C8TH77_PERMB
MESLDRRRTGSEQEEGFGVEARRATDLGMVPNLRRSNSSLHKSRRLLCPFIEKQENLSSWIPENIKKKECVYFVESSKLSDAGSASWWLLWLLKLRNKVCHNPVLIH